MFKHLVIAAILAAPCAAFAGQAMSADDGFAVASNTPGEIDAVIAPLQDGGADTMHEPGAGRGVDESDNRVQSETSQGAPAHGHAAGSEASSGAHAAHKGHGRAPWQSLLPGAMK